MGKVILEKCLCVSHIQSCLILYDPMDCSLSGFSVHRILQAIILEWVAISFSRGYQRIFLIQRSNPGLLYCRRRSRCKSNPWVGKIPGAGHGNSLQYSCQENPMDRVSLSTYQVSVFICDGIVSEQLFLSLLLTISLSHVLCYILQQCLLDPSLSSLGHPPIISP